MRIDRVKLAAELVRKDMTIKRLSELSGLSCATVSNIKCGRACSPVTAKRLADVLGLNVSELMEERR
jgi:putative transcriptional regulator